ncbi:MAG: GC-type dockerin domain-anchored protein [Planctomycetota bacterium]|nr:GC-type dockerin domain-anchored protein [Planctomycetota bacterium]
MRIAHIRTAAALAALAAAPVLADEYVVELSGLNFLYNGQSNMDIDLTIRPGDTVRWVWVSGFHNVVSGPFGGHDGEYRSGDPENPPAEFSHTFNDPTDSLYHCHVHGGAGMVSMVKVRCSADYNEDLNVNTLDVLAFLNDWSAGDEKADFNGDGSVNTLDVLSFLNAWSSGC